MPPEPIKPTSTLPAEGEGQKHLDREIREMISALAHRLTNLQHVHKPGSSHHATECDDDHGVSIITLTGTNTGATMRSELDDKPQEGENDALGTYVNSNFQAINNSLMLSGSYNTNDPGVHLEITDYVEHQHEHEHEHEHEHHRMHGKKEKKKKDKETSKSDQHSDHSD
ncbi:uncharacterized protein LOC132308116 [Cornus florida]|uniref:uncharacterized protein LOC132308116 n=1 Tax=Cornus florida TaxID=4283 RepID=UPI00289893D7|nr:uncharacterized protein LOC132308116 [Cornus florida]